MGVVKGDKLEDLKALLGDDAEAKETGIVYDLLRRRAEYARLLIFFFVKGSEGKMRLDLAEVIDFLKHEYNSVKNWVRAFTKTGLINISYRPHQYFYIHINLDKFEQRYIDAAKEILKP